MVDEVKSIDIKLYSVSKVEAAFEAAEADDEQPAADVIAVMKPKILEHLAAGRSINWVISVLQRGGINLGARQLRTYLQRAGIGTGAKRVAKGSSGGARRSSQKPKGADAQEGTVQGGIVGAGSHADGVRAENMQNSCSERDDARAQDVQPAKSGFGDIPTGDMQAVHAEDMQNIAQAGVEQVPAGMDAVPAEDMQAVSADAGGAPTLQTHRARKTSKRGSGADVGGAPADGGQAEQALTPEEQAELAEFDSAGADEF